MKRKDFLEKFGIGLAIAAVVPVMDSCTKNNSGQPQDVDFNLDLNDAANSALKTKGGFVYKDNVIIIRDKFGNYQALSKICTHQQCTVEYDGPSNILQCPCHGSIFDINGYVAQGPAAISLPKYKTTLNGNLLHVSKM